MRLIECRRCDASDCEGCNLFTLAKMLHKGKLDCLMDEHHSIVITPESLRPKGRWIMHDDEILGLSCECSVCHIETCGDSPYCPNCGAKMMEG